MKKAFSFLLVLILVLNISITAFATDTSISEAKYYGYRLLNLTAALKPGLTCDHNADAHDSECYNYPYTVNEKYRTFLQEEVFHNASTDLWPDHAKPTSANGVSDDDILKYLSSRTSDGEGDKPIRPIADRVYRAIKAAAVEPDSKLEELSEAATIETQGYWLFADVRKLNGQTKVNSLAMLDTRDLSSLNLSEKTALPTIEKKVKDIEDSEDSNILDNAWHDSADHDFGDTVPFKLTATLPSNAQAYTSYQLVFHDQLAPGLTLNLTSFQVYMYATKHKADVDTDLNDHLNGEATLVKPTLYEIKTTGLDANCTFEVIIPNAFAITGVTKDSAFVVYYEATLNESAAIGAAGNSNTVKLGFSNNAYDAKSLGYTNEDTVTVYTYQLTINKVDAGGTALPGAVFSLYKYDPGNKNKDENGYILLGKLGTKDDTMQQFVWKGIDDGDYKLVEDEAPSGYNKMEDMRFSISATHSETADTPQLLTLDGGLMGEGKTADGALTGVIEKNIENKTGTVLPSTGAQGTMMLIGGGTMLVMLAAIFMVTRKKMSIYED